MSQAGSPATSRRSSVVTTAGDVSGGAPPKKFMNGWTPEQEKLMAQWADIAACYRWLHDRSQKKFSSSNNWITIPVIILSTLTGTANFAMDSFIPPGDESSARYAQAAIGAVSIFAGILTTLGNFFQYAQNSEAHRVASVSWGKFQRLIQVELAINPMDRIEAMDFLKICRQDLDRLIEQSPPVPDDIIAAFEVEFKDIPNLKVPDICHGIEHTQVFDSAKPRLMKLTADAAIFLKQRKKLLREDILPDIDKRISKDLQEQLDAQLEKRVRQILADASPVASPPPEEEHEPETVTTAVVNLETDWRRLLVGRKHILSPTPPTGGTPPNLSPPPERADAGEADSPDTNSILINVVGTDGASHIPPTPVSTQVDFQ